MRLLDVTVDNQAGIKRCISPYKRTRFKALARNTLRLQPLSLSAIPVIRAINAFAICEGILRITILSLRSLRQPATKSSSSFNSLATMRGISTGSFCKSPSIVTITSARAASMPACMAAVCLKLRASSTKRTNPWLCLAACSIASRVPSVLPSSTKINSQGHG